MGMMTQVRTSRTRPRKTGEGIISPARRAAFEILRRVEEERAFASTLLAALDDEMRADDRALTNELVLGVLRRQLWLDRVIEQFSGRNIQSLDLEVRLALRLGLYQIRYLTRVPASAAVNEAVSMMYAARLRSAASFVNAVLRRAARELDYDPAANLTDPLERIAIETSHPAWLIQRWVNNLGLAEAERFARANNEPAPVALRFTLRATERKAILSELGAAGAKLEPSRIVPEAWRTKGAASAVQKLARAGLIYLQDEASQLVAHLLEARAGDNVLDVCAAPGSKAMHVAALQPAARIVAGDLHEHRLETLRHLAAVQGADTVKLVAHDALRGLPFKAESFDRVLVDAPCTGTGTLRHNPEIRWRITAADIAELAARQILILDNAAKMVRPGGCLIYSTCSVEPEENEDVVQAFTSKNADFDSRELSLTGPAVSSELLTGSGALRTWPHKNDVDGFFIRAFIKRAS